MSRYLVDTPENYVYRSHYQVEQSDLNIGGHISADAVFSMTIRKRAELFDSIGEARPSSDSAGVFFMVNTTMDFIGEASLGDDLSLDMCAESSGEKTIDVIMIVNQSCTQKPVARVCHRLIYMDVSAHRPAAVPEFLKVKLGIVQK